MTARAKEIGAKVEAFVREVVVPYERDPRCGVHGPSDALVQELRAKAREAGVLSPHILPDGHLTQLETAHVLIRSGLSPLGPLACNTMAPDEGNMYLIGKIGTEAQKRQFLAPMIAGEARSAFLMSEPAAQGGAGSDPSMMQTTARLDGNHWVINGCKAFITGADGARIGIVMARTDDGAGKLAATMFLVDLPDPAVRIERVLDAALKVRGELPYACKGGVCSTCKAKVVAGEVTMARNYALEPDEVARGMVLTCQSHPVTDRVVVDYDQ